MTRAFFLFGLGLLLASGGLGAARAAEPARTLTISAPESVAAGAAFEVRLLGATDFPDERIGFLHAEWSADGGKTWTALCYESDVPGGFDRRNSLTAGATGTRVLVRVRAAFRGSAAGDVDFRGGAIRWTDTWVEWRQPPAKVAVIAVK